MQTGFSCRARPSTHPSLRLSRFSIPSKGAARSSNVSFPSLALTQVPPEPLSPAPEQRPGPREQAVHQGDTDVLPLPTVPRRRCRHGQQLQPPVQPPEGCEGGTGHQEPRGRHGRAGGLGPDRFRGPLRTRPPTHPTPARETVSRVAGGAAFLGSPARPAWGTRSNFSRAGPRSLGWTVIGAAARPPPLEPRQPTASRPSNRLRSGGSRNPQCNGAQGTSGKSTEVSPSSQSPELFRASEIGH